MPMIDASTKSFLEEFFNKTASKQDVQIIELAMLKTHVHMVIRTPPRIDLPRLVQFFKGGSSFAASRQPDNVCAINLTTILMKRSDSVL
jgi:REP element-mobilizing transposase RayT